MAIETIDVGSAADDGTGDYLRTAMQIVNDNFAELDARTNRPSAYLGWGNVSVATGSTPQQITDGDLTTTINADSLWTPGSNRIDVPAGYSYVRITFDGGFPGASGGGGSYDYWLEIRKNGATATGTSAEPTCWSDAQNTSAAPASSNDVTGLAVYDAVNSAGGDYYTFWMGHDKGSAALAVGNIHVELIE